MAGLKLPLPFGCAGTSALRPSKAYGRFRCTEILDVAQVSPRLVGLALAQVLSLSGTMQW